MHGYGYPPEQPPKRRPSSATLTAVRVVLVAMTVLSLGFLAWGAMLRLAIVTRRARDWALLALVFALNTGLFAFMLAMPEDPDRTTDAEAFIGVTWMFGVMVGAVAYYLYAEIRHYGPDGPYGAHPHPPRYQPHFPPQLQPQLRAQQPHPYGGYAPTRHPAPAPAVPPPAVRPPSVPQRLDQVRAELDELSDYLRKEGEGR
ncbi:hypothetical protein PUR28_32060 [Streptomyces sp. BE308]|uniref:hypothetical protein n=1 Tax=Streptomyces sp. BE308 TaxID=3002529 RepID=UPI002E75F600|nr:hypothetical protein [Streptomyces sp. BE308]MEE1795359.1 hypothetical protein [Streptomyces sp. BE308]